MGTYRQKSFLLNKFNKFKRHCAMFGGAVPRYVFQSKLTKVANRKPVSVSVKRVRLKIKTRVAAVQTRAPSRKCLNHSCD